MLVTSYITASDIGGDVTNNNLRSSGVSTAAMSDVTNAAAAIMFECDVCFGVHFCEDMATVDGWPTPSVLIALRGGLQITNIAHALSVAELCQISLSIV